MAGIFLKPKQYFNSIFNANIKHSPKDYLDRGKWGRFFKTLKHKIPMTINHCEASNTYFLSESQMKSIGIK
jgi:hypothetical protein